MRYGAILADQERACSVSGCLHRPRTKGLCEGHYKRLRVYGDPTGRPKPYTVPAPKELTGSTIAAVDIGTAAEHLVCADLLLAGHKAFMTAAGLSYDVVLDIGDRLLRVQVKAATRPRNVNTRGCAERLGYIFDVRRRGKKGVRRLNDAECDLIACVALDIRAIAYVPLRNCPMTLCISQPGYTFPGAVRKHLGGIRNIDQWSLPDALNSISVIKS